MFKNFNMVIEETKLGGYRVSVPGLPGCVVEGDTLEEAIDEARDAITRYLEVMETQSEAMVERDHAESDVIKTPFG